ncbi:hypothetical protein Q5530_13900 [Saccharothrix sp. BKS2]|uniref:hypothetical protein n=1 Tax=Saccharothrix sp. BKS2 TaxID=3064400 RepID=UPI0039ECA416
MNVKSKVAAVLIAVAVAGAVPAVAGAGAAPDPNAVIEAAVERVTGAERVRAWTTATADLADEADDRTTLTDRRGRSIGAALVGASPAAGRAGDGRTVFRDALPATDAGVERTGSGLRLTTVLKDGRAPEEFRFALSLPEGSAPLPRANGSVDVVDPAGRVVASINKPWAFDATGAAVPTRYRVEGSVLVQRVEHGGAAYPVVADPSIDFGLTSATITLNPKDQRIILSGGGVAAGGLLGALICSGSGPGAALCAIGGAVIGEIVFEAIKEYAVKDNCDLEVTIGYVPPRVTNVEQVCH